MNQCVSRILLLYYIVQPSGSQPKGQTPSKCHKINNMRRHQIIKVWRPWEKTLFFFGPFSFFFSIFKNGWLLLFLFIYFLPGKCFYFFFLICEQVKQLKKLCWQKKKVLPAFTDEQKRKNHRFSYMKKNSENGKEKCFHRKKERRSAT